MRHRLTIENINLLIKFRKITGASNATVASEIGVNEATVRRWIKREVPACNNTAWRNFLLLAEKQGLITADKIPPAPVEEFRQRSEYSEIFKGLTELNREERLEILNSINKLRLKKFKK